MKWDRVNIIRHTTNFEPMLRFYVDILGGRVIEQWNEPGNQGAVLDFAACRGNVTVEVLNLAGIPVAGASPVNLEISFFVEDVVAVHEALAAAGQPIARGIEDAPWGIRSFGIDDPDRLRIWVQQEIPPRA